MCEERENHTGYGKRLSAPPARPSFYRYELSTRSIVFTLRRCYLYAVFRSVAAPRPGSLPLLPPLRSMKIYHSTFFTGKSK